MKRKTKKHIDRNGCKPNGSLADENVNMNGRRTNEWLNSHDNCNKKLVNYDQVPSFFQEPFIMSAYRQCPSSAWECVVSLFQATNETMNIWSHVLALVVFVIRFWSIFSTHKPWEDSYVYPLLSFAVGISLMLMMSAGAHLFNCMSIKVRYICFFFDYAAISVYTFTAGQVFYFYSRPIDLNLALFNTPNAFLIISALISFVSTFACCDSLWRRSRFEAAVKAGTYITSWVFNTSPYWLSMTSCNPSNCSSASSIHYFTRHCLFYAGGTLAYVMHIPEHLMIGVFDVLGHSHHFLHILCAVGVSDEFTAVEMDMMQRRATLEEFHAPTFTNSILLTCLVVVGNIGVVFWCAKQLKHKKSK